MRVIARSVFRRVDGTWVNQVDGSDRGFTTHPTQQDAVARARAMLAAAGGGELIVVHGEDGTIRSKDTVPPGNDPYPPRDKEH